MGRTAGSDSVGAALRAAAADDSVRAVVLHVDSPGGSAVASETIWREVSVLRAAKPVVVREDVELMIRWLNRLWASLEERNNFGPGNNRAQARAMLDRGLAHYRAKLN